MIKTVWVQAHFMKKGTWEEYEEVTGEKTKSLFGKKAVTEKKKRWVELDEYGNTRRDGQRLAQDIESVLNRLETEGFEIVSATPVESGEYSCQEFGRGGQFGANTCASWGYSFTEGILVTARRR